MLQHHSIPINTVEIVDTTSDIPIITAEEDTVYNVEEIGYVAEVVRATVI